MKTKLLTLLLLVGSSMFAQNRFSIQIGIGTPAYDARPPTAVTYASPPRPLSCASKAPENINSTETSSRALFIS
jgi:hypothetical protein